MALEKVKELIPEYAKDLNLNLANILNSELLTELQLWGTLVATAMSSRNETLKELIFAEAATYLSVDALNSAKSASAIMGMNNVYFRFTHTADNKNYITMHSGLRMNVLAHHPGAEKNDFELWNLAVSAMNGCQYCINAHEQLLLKNGISSEQVQQAVKIAAIINGIATCV